MMWKDSYALGIERIDRQHKELFRMTGELVEAVKKDAPAEEYRKALAFLKDYVVYHFRDEEAYQESIRYSGIAAHKEEHRRFTQAVLAYEKQLEASGFDRSTMKDLAGMVTTWLIYHVVDTDQKIVRGGQSEQFEKDFHRCVDLFAHSALEVLELMGGVDSSQVKQHPAVPYHMEEDVLIQLELIGDVKGRVIFGYSKEVALGLVRSMTMMEPDGVDELVLSALCELTNISCGNAATALTQRGLQCDIKPPVVMEDMERNTDAPGVSMDTGSGRMEVAVLLDDPDQQILPR